MIIDSVQWIIETLFILGHRIQGRGELGRWMHPVRLFLGFFQNNFEQKPLVTVSELRFRSPFYRQNLAIPPPPLKSTFEFIYSEANPQFFWHFPDRWIKVLYWRLFQSHFKTWTRELTLWWRPASRSEKSHFSLIPLLCSNQFSLVFR